MANRDLKFVRIGSALTMATQPNKLDASGGSAFLNLLGAAEGALIRRRVNSTVMPLRYEREEVST
jgi:hypothetical protein